MKPSSIRIFLIIITLSNFACDENTNIIQALITDISPESDGPGVEIRISGQGFGSDISSVSIDFNGVSAQVLSLSDSMLITKVPSGASTGKINIQIGSQEVSSVQDFVVLEGIWTEKESIPFNQGFSAAVGFAYGGKGYLGTGTENGSFLDEFWEYNASNDTWTSINPIPNGKRHSCTDFVVGDFAYVGLGRIKGETEFTNTFYQYDFEQGVWTSISSFPDTLPDFNDLRVGFSFGTKAYMIVADEVWEYDTVANEWSLKTNYPGEGIASLVAEVIGEFAYIGVGFNEAQDWWRYDLQNNQWLELSSYPTDDTWGLSSFVIEDRVFLIGRECWEYNPNSNQWLRRTSHPDGRRFAASFSIDNKGYLGTGTSWTLPGPPRMKDLWEFEIQ